MAKRKSGKTKATAGAAEKKRGPGRPPGSGNKAKRKPGRPAGTSAKKKSGRGPGRPPGAWNKTGAVRRGPGRPAGSGNKTKRGPGRPPKSSVEKRGPGRPPKFITISRGPGRPPKAGVAKRGPGRPPKSSNPIGVRISERDLGKLLDLQSMILDVQKMYFKKSGRFDMNLSQQFSDNSKTVDRIVSIISKDND